VKQVPTNGSSVPPQISKIFAKRPIMAGEDPDAYDQLLAAVMAEYEPESISEFLLVKDMANAEWDLLRLYRFKADMVNASIPKVLTYDRYYGALDNKTYERVTDLLHRARQGDREAQKGLDAVLAKNHLTLDDVMAAAFKQNVASQSLTDRMINWALARRHAACRELERLRTLKLSNGAAAPARPAAPAANGRIVA
jgi:hypothetical protein